MSAKMINARTATVIGGTGLIGSELLELLQQDEYFEKVKAVVRRPVDFGLSKVETAVIDFTDFDAFKKVISGSEAVYCAVGTTNKKVKGDKSKYRKVDYDIPVDAAKICEEVGCNVFLVVSAVGANSQSGNFYLKLKGEVEDTIQNMNIKSVSFFRPSMLLGNRNEFRFGESLGKILMKPLSFLIPSKYKPIQARDVALAMINVSKKNTSGVHFYHYADIKAIL